MRHNLTNCTFTIPFMFENPDRLRNLECVIDYLLKHFNTNIIVYEHGLDSARELIDKKYKGQVGYYRMRADADIFPKTQLLNLMASYATTKVIVSMDADVIFHPQHYVAAYHSIMDGDYDFVYPFNRGTINIPEEKVKLFKETLTLDSLKMNDDIQAMEETIKERGLNCPQGGCLFMNREAFWEIGGENEKFFNYNTEDACRHIRIKILGRKMKNINGLLFHLNHEKTLRSTHENGHWVTGWTEFDKVSKMTHEELQQYIKTDFTWIDNYTNNNLQY